MATGEDKSKYTHYSLGQERGRERISCLYASDRPQKGNIPTNIVQCLQLDHVTSSCQPKLYREHYVNNGLTSAKYLYSQNVIGHTGCINAVNFSNTGEELLVSGGDDEKVRLWRVSEIMRGENHSVPMETEHTSNIFTATFSCDNTYIYSGGNDGNLIKHDAATGKQVSVHPHCEAVYSVSAHPFSPDTIITASEDGIVRNIDSRLPHFTEDADLAKDYEAFQCASFNPVEPCLVATGNAHRGSALYDTRIRKKVFSYCSSKYLVFGEDVVSVSFSRDGQFLFTMQRRKPPCLYQTTQPHVAATFMDESGDYMNIVSMKTGCFVGANDEYVASGSDDFRIYLWKIPEDLDALKSSAIDGGVVPSPHMVLPGHRSIANQIRYSPTHHLLCSSGVEKIIKLWSHLPLSPEATLQHSGGPPSRKRYTQREFLQLSVGEEAAENDMSDQEDHAVLAFFDALVNEEVRGQNWPNSSSDEFDSPRSVTTDFPSSDDSLSRDIWPVSPFDSSPIDFMRYPYPDEEPGRATWDFMTPQERWDWHHGRRDWYYENGDDEDRGTTPSSIETGTTSSWSDGSEMEGDYDGEGACKCAIRDAAGLSGDETEDESEREEGTEDGRGSRKGRCYRSQGRKKKERDGEMVRREFQRTVAIASLQSCTLEDEQTIVECSNKEQGENNTDDLPKSIPPVRFYSSCQKTAPAQPSSGETASGSVKKKLCSQGGDNVPSTSSGTENKLGEGGEQSCASPKACGSHSGGREAAASTKGKAASRKGKHVKRRSNEELPC